MTVSFHLQVDFYANRYVGTNLSNPSFADISRTMGAEGIRVTKPEEVGPALTSLINSGKPGVLEIVVSQVNKINVTEINIFEGCLNSMQIPLIK